MIRRQGHLKDLSSSTDVMSLLLYGAATGSNRSTGANFDATNPMAHIFSNCSRGSDDNSCKAQ